MKKLVLSLAALVGLTAGAIAQTAELNISDAQKNISTSKTTYILKDKKLVPGRRAGAVAALARPGARRARGGGRRGSQSQLHCSAAGWRT